MVPVGLTAQSRLGFSPGACASPSKGSEGARPARMSSVRGPRLAKGFAEPSRQPKVSWREFGLAISCSKQRCRLCLWGIMEDGVGRIVTDAEEDSQWQHNTGREGKFSE